MTTVPIHGAAGIYTSPFVFNGGDSRDACFDSGSSLSWSVVRSGDLDLPTDGQTDGDSYADGQSFEAVFHYGEFQIGEMTIPDAGMLVVTDSIKYSTRAIIGLSPRRAGKCFYDYKPHPGDLSKRIIEGIGDDKFVTFHIDNEQAHNSIIKTNESKGEVILGGLRGEENEYLWTGKIVNKSDWIVEMSISFEGPENTTSSVRVRVLVDSGNSHFKLLPALAEELWGAWGFSMENDEIIKGGERDEERLSSCKVNLGFGDSTVSFDARDLILTDGNGALCRQCNRITALEMPDDSHNCVIGMAVFGARTIDSVAFDFEKLRVGFRVAE